MAAETRPNPDVRSGWSERESDDSTGTPFLSRAKREKPTTQGKLFELSVVAGLLNKTPQPSGFFDVQCAKQEVRGGGPDVARETKPRLEHPRILQTIPLSVLCFNKQPRRGPGPPMDLLLETAHQVPPPGESLLAGVEVNSCPWSVETHLHRDCSLYPHILMRREWVNRYVPARDER